MYDEANRLTSIDHKGAFGNMILKLNYQYLDNDLVSVITESDITGPVATVTFGYDNRGRLISEVRTGQSSYDLAYEYGQGGNRTKKTRTISDSHWFEDRYTYDYQDPGTYGSDNNRLMKYETWEYSQTVVFFGAMTQGSGEIMQGSDLTAQGSGAMTQGFGGPIETLLSTTYYYYSDEGNVTRVVTEKVNPTAGQPQYEATRLAYARNGRVVTYGLGETWDRNGKSIINHTITYAREFRYDSARQRYLNRELDPAQLLNGTLVEKQNGDTQ